MDKKAKKRLEVLRKRVRKTELQLAGAKEQDDTPGEVERIQQDIADLKAEIEKLKNS